MKPSHNILSFGINGSLRKKEHLTHNNPVEYYLFNSAANLKAYSYDGLDFAYYGYNASNTRAYKLSMLNTNQWVNGEPQPIQLQMQQAMFYPNAYLNFNHNGEYTKHYYNGSERIASRLGDMTAYIYAEAGERLENRIMRLDALFRSQIGELVSYEEPPAPAIPADRSGGTRELVSPPVEYEPFLSVSSLQQTGSPDDIFYYHMNHLGSTAFVTDQNQNITQGFLYAPFGEITTEYNANFGDDVIPKYSFNAKELDEETGMYYYEARYYKPPVFTSRDPMMDQKPWLTPYHYCSNNPVGRVDPNGMMDDDPPTNPTIYHLEIKENTAIFTNADGNSNTFDLQNNAQRAQLVETLNKSLASGATIAGIMAIPGEKSNASFRLTNSKGELDFKFYANGWKGNQYVTPTQLAKLAKGIKVGGNVMGALSAIISLTQAATASNNTERNWYFADAVMGGVGVFGGTLGLAASLYYSLVVKNADEIFEYLKKDAIDRTDLIQQGYPALRIGMR